MESNLNMREVAERAGVSVATVSRALRTPEKVSRETVAKVVATARELGYVYNATAGDILKGRSTVIGVLVPMASNALFGETLHGIQDVALAAGHSVIQGTTRYEGSMEEAMIESLLQRRVHALIATGVTYEMEPRLERIAEDARVRIVLVWEKPESSRPYSFVGFDNRDAAERVTDHFIGLGHRRIGLIVGPFSRIARGAPPAGGLSERAGTGRYRL